MKAAIIAFAALLTLSGVAFAGAGNESPAKSNVQQEQVDTRTTGSIKNDDQESTKSPRMGIDLDPFSFGTFH